MVVVVDDSDSNSKSTPSSPLKADTTISTSLLSPSTVSSQGDSTSVINSHMGNPPPPAYSNYNGAGVTQPLLSVPVYVQTQRDNSGRQACRRFTKAFLYAILIYALVSMLVGSMTVNVNSSGGSNGQPPVWISHPKWKADSCVAFGEQFSPESNTSLHFLGHSGTSLAEDRPIVPPSDFPSVSKATLKLSLAAPEHLIVSSRGWGSISFVTETASDISEISVEIFVHYYRKVARDRASVCKIKTESGGEGVGLYVPVYHRSLPKEDQVAFTVVVKLPVGGAPPFKSTPTYIRSFETSLALFTHTIVNLENLVEFGSLKLLSANSHIHADHISAKFLKTETSNAAITGTFHTNDSLVIQTANARIDVIVHLDYTKTASCGNTSVTMNSANGRLKGRVHLNNPLDLSGTKYAVMAHTANAPIELGFPVSPQSSFLDLEAITANSGIDVQLHEAFEGTFSASTVLSRVDLKLLERDDPSGQGRQRIVNTSQKTRNNVEGVVTWGGRREQPWYGKVNLHTGLGRISLAL